MPIRPSSGHYGLWISRGLVEMSNPTSDEQRLIPLRRTSVVWPRLAIKHFRNSFFIFNSGAYIWGFHIVTLHLVNIRDDRRPRRARLWVTGHRDAGRPWGGGHSWWTRPSLDWIQAPNGPCGEELESFRFIFCGFLDQTKVTKEPCS